MNIKEKCLTCGKEERIVGFKPYKYYGWWCFCNCPRYWDPPWWVSPNISLANTGNSTQEVCNQERKLPMFAYGVVARTCLQEAEESDKKGPIYGLLTFEVQANDWASAADAAAELIPDVYSIISVSELGVPQA